MYNHSEFSIISAVGVGPLPERPSVSCQLNAAKTVALYANMYDARVQIASTPSNDEHIIAVLHDDHVFAAASSKVSQMDALIRLADRIRSKQV